MFAVILIALLITVPVRADLRDTDNAADYIILTNQEVLSNNSWINDLLAYREAQGRTAMAVTVEEIWDEFTPSNQNGIRDFLHYAYENWQEPRLKDVFIVGHTDIVPSVPRISDLIPSVTFLSDYSFSLANFDSVEQPRFQVGRLPWFPDSPVPMPNFLEKIQSYELREVGVCDPIIQLAAASPQDINEFEDWAEAIADHMPGFEFERDYLGREPGDPDYADSAEIVSHLNFGPWATFFFGYPSSNQLLWGIVDSDNVTELTNAPCYSIYGGLTARDLGMSGALSTAMGNAVLNQNGGAICGLGCTAVPWATAGSRFESSLAAGLANLTNTTIGDCYADGIATYLEDGQGSSTTYETVLTSVLLGDPATIIPGRSTSADPIAAPVVPSSIQIVGNYPNPFNPTTTVSFLLNRAGNASLAVFDITGRTVATLADRDFTAGQHNLVWDATGLASGMYLVRLEAAGQFDTHRITLLK